MNSCNCAHLIKTRFADSKKAALATLSSTIPHLRVRVCKNCHLADRDSGADSDPIGPVLTMADPSAGTSGNTGISGGLNLGGLQLNNDDLKKVAAALGILLPAAPPPASVPITPAAPAPAKSQSKAVRNLEIALVAGVVVLVLALVIRYARREKK